MASGTKGRTTMEVGADGIALITLINPPVNSLSFDVLISLKENYEQALRRDDVKAIVVTGAKDKFSGGFDITAFEGLRKGKEEGPKANNISIDILTDTIEAARKPSVAAIDGLALGGGLELAMVPGVTNLGLKPRRVNKVAILGGGLMGSGIATALILSNYPVILKEVNDKFLQVGIDRVRANLQSRVKKGKMTQEKFEKTMSLLRGVLDYESFKDVDMVIEAVIENVSLKQQIFADLERYCPPHCILASNTSTIDLNLIGERTKSKDRIIGAHFFSPAHVMLLLEIVRTNHTSPQVIVDLLDVGKKIKKTPVVVGNCTGFAVNRVFFPYTQAAILLVERGADPYLIDRAITKFGMLMGPFRLVDLVGFGVGVATGRQFVENFPERTYKSMLLTIMQEDKRAGENTHKGFYLYDDKRKASPDPEVKKYLEKARSISGVAIDPKFVKLSEKDIVEMIFFPVVNEACRVFAEGIVVKAADLDIASVMGMGFPRYRGGILFWADLLGSKYIYSRLDKWSKSYGEFFKPCTFLAERAAKGAPLSAPVEQAKSRL